LGLNWGGEDYITKDKRPQNFFHIRAITPVWNDRGQVVVCCYFTNADSPVGEWAGGK